MRVAAGPLGRRLRRLSTDADYRQDVLWRLLARPRGLFQPYGDTAEDRYPELFARVRAEVADSTDTRLLSFGCASGEEVFTLRRYFPMAAITGVDINPHRIRSARRKLAGMSGEGRMDFAVAASGDALGASLFDAIFCLAVFRHGRLQFGPAPCSDHLIRFGDFERVVTGLVRCLKPGGLLVLRHANFRFRDTAVAARFEIVGGSGATGPESGTPIYDPNDRLVPDAWEDQAIFRLVGRSR